MNERKDKNLLNHSRQNEVRQRVISDTSNNSLLERMVAADGLADFIIQVDEKLVTTGLDEGQLKILNRVYMGTYHYKNVKKTR